MGRPSFCCLAPKTHEGEENPNASPNVSTPFGRSPNSVDVAIHEKVLEAATELVMGRSASRRSPIAARSGGSPMAASAKKWMSPLLRRASSSRSRSIQDQILSPELHQVLLHIGLLLGRGGASAKTRSRLTVTRSKDHVSFVTQAARLNRGFRRRNLRRGRNPNSLSGAASDQSSDEVDGLRRRIADPFAAVTTRSVQEAVLEGTSRVSSLDVLVVGGGVDAEGDVAEGLAVDKEVEEVQGEGSGTHPCCSGGSAIASGEKESQIPL